MMPVMTVMNDPKTTAATEGPRAADSAELADELASRKAHDSRERLIDAIGNNVMTWISAGTAHQLERKLKPEVNIGISE
jgi:hypothetical protein